MIYYAYSTVKCVSRIVYEDTVEGGFVYYIAVYERFNGHIKLPVYISVILNVSH